MNKKHKKIYTTLNYIEHFLILASTVTGCISTSAFGFLFPIGIRSFAIGLKVCPINAWIKKYNSIIEKRKKKQ